MTNTLNHAHSSSVAEPSASRQLQVLVVDDDPDFLAQQQANIEALGHTVLAATNPSEARQVLAQHQPDIALLDLMMDTADAGFMLCHHVKQVYSDMPVILVTSAESITGYDLHSVRSTAKEWMGADAVLSKPIRLEQLKHELERCNER